VSAALDKTVLELPKVRTAERKRRQGDEQSELLATSDSLLPDDARRGSFKRSVREDWASRKRLQTTGARRQLLSTDTAVELELHLHEISVCGTSNNMAQYGPCIATDYRSLSVHYAAKTEYPGVSFEVQVSKRDAYNQTMTSDSSSGLSLLTAKDGARVSDPSVRLGGQVFGALKKGSAVFTFSVIPGYVNMTHILRIPHLYFQGSESTPKSRTTMESNVFAVTLFSGESVCQPGYILSMGEQSADGPDKWRSGSCSQCRAGTYSLSPLAKASSGAENEPSCLKCPAGGAPPLDTSMNTCVL